MKNDLAAGVLPSKYFGANAAWLRLAVIAYNVLTALKRLALPADLLTTRPKRLRFFDFPYAWSTGASCSTTELATGDGHLQSAFFEALRKCTAPWIPDGPHKPTGLAQRPKSGLWERIDFASTRIQAPRTVHYRLTDGLGLFGG